MGSIECDAGALHHLGVALGVGGLRPRQLGGPGAPGFETEAGHALAHRGLHQRLGDVIMSFPSLLLAVIVLYMLEPSVTNIVLVLAITRIPIYLRTTRAEVLEVRERMFVQAAKVMGASYWRIVFHHILPVIFPTLVTIATLDFAFVMLAESSLSFLGIGIQAPEITWGLMVAQGRPYLTNAWWLSFWPGLAIILTTLSLNLLSNWLRIALDPTQRWRLEMRGRKNG